MFGLVERHLGEVREEGGREVRVRGAVARDDIPSGCRERFKVDDPGSREVNPVGTIEAVQL